MDSTFIFDEFELDLARRELRRAGVATKADALVLRLLEAFLRRPNELITKEALIAQVWEGRAVSENALTVAVNRLRKILEHRRGAREMVLTVHGYGYRFVPAVGLRESPAPLLAAASTTTFVGRERVIADLSEALLEARSGRGSAYVITGDAGIGKTRVATELAAGALAANVSVAWGYCHDIDGAPPLWPFAELLSVVAQRLSHAELAQDAELLTRIPELARRVPELAKLSLIADEPDSAIKLTSKHGMFVAISRVLTRAAEHSPYLLILDDLHRADEASLELLHYLLADVAHRRILLVVNVRCDGARASELSLSRVINHRNCMRIALRPLSEEHVESYVRALLGGRASSLCHAVFERSEGNPLFMTELARQLRQTERPDIIALTSTIPSVAVELVRERSAGLSDDVRELLACAAVIGRSFGLPLLQATTGHDAASMMIGLDSAIARRLVMPTRDSPTEFAFTHELLRAAIYEALDPAQKRQWHLRVAQALKQCVALGQASSAELAHHSRSALPDGDLRQAVRHCIDASEAAVHIYAYADAARHLEHARQALDLITNASHRLRFSLLWRQAAIERGHSVAAFLPLAEQLLHLAREQGAGVPLAQAALLLDPFPGFPRLPGSRGALAEALASLPEAAPTMRGGLMARLATHVPLAYCDAESTGQISQALELARKSPELGDLMSALFADLFRHGGPAASSRANAAANELQTICNERAATLTLPPVLLDIHRAVTALQKGDVPTVTRALERAEARCREFDIDLLWHVERFRALMQINLGATSDGLTALIELQQRVHTVGPVLGAEVFGAYDQTVVLPVCQVASDRERWQHALEPDTEDPPNIWALKVRSLAAAGAMDEARHALQSVGPDALTKLPCDREYLGTLGSLARAALTLRATAYARVLYELLAPYPEHFAVNMSFLCEDSVAALLGLLARSLGNHGQALRHFETAVAISERAGLTLCAARARSGRSNTVAC